VVFDGSRDGREHDRFQLPALLGGEIASRDFGVEAHTKGVCQGRGVAALGVDFDVTLAAQVFGIEVFGCEAGIRGDDGRGIGAERRPDAGRLRSYRRSRGRGGTGNRQSDDQADEVLAPFRVGRAGQDGGDGVWDTIAVDVARGERKGVAVRPIDDPAELARAVRSSIAQLDDGSAGLKWDRYTVFAR
jgi:hypothetical protein